MIKKLLYGKYNEINYITAFTISNQLWESIKRIISSKKRGELGEKTRNYRVRKSQRGFKRVKR